MKRIGTRLGFVAGLTAFVSLGQATSSGETAASYPLASRLGSGVPLFGAARRTCGDCNVILVSIDTLRQDHVGVYGYERDTTPAVDAFAADSVRFDTAIAQAPSTLPSHASIFTSMIPEHHRALHALDQPIPAEAVTLAEILWQAGFRTGGFTAGAQMHRKYGVDQGFDVFANFEGTHTHERRFFDIVAQGKEFLREHGDERFFLLLHTYEVHSPYTPPVRYLRQFDPDYRGDLGDEIPLEYLRAVFDNPIRLRVSEADRQHIVAAYDGEIRNMDDAFAELIAFLKSRGLYDDTLIIFTSDHGEELGERGRVGWHSWTLYEELLRVPLIIKFPAGHYAGEVVNEVARGIDLLPTILDVLEVPAPAGLSFEGGSLMDRVTGRRSEVVYAVSQRDLGGELPTAIRSERWKLYEGALFDLAADPLERFDVAAKYPLVTTALAASLAAIRSQRALADAAPIVLDEDLRRQLRALGYIQ